MLLQHLVQSIKSKQVDVDEFADEAQAVKTIITDPKVSTHANQLATRYQTLLNNTKVRYMDIIAFLREILLSQM